MLNELKKHKLKNEYDSLKKSEFIECIIEGLGDKSLQDLLNECVRKEATDMTLIIVHEKKGWFRVKDTIDRITCPRITCGAPRINYSFP